MNYGFNAISLNIMKNAALESITISGEDYEYLCLDDFKVKNVNELFQSVLEKDKVRFLELNKLKIPTIRQLKILV